jgi:cathepsin L
VAHGNEQYKDVWQAWKTKFERVYEGAEEGYRFRVFCDNAVKVAKHNLEESLGLHTFTLGLNNLADLSVEEYRSTYLTLLPRNGEKLGLEHVDDGAPQADQVDWRTKGAVTGVKNQGQCGSCWSFGATGALEGAYFLAKGNLLSFSEQQQVDCNRNCYGCNGGWSEYSFHYWESTGANLESDYRYTGRDGSCKTNNYKQYTTVSNYYNTQSGSESSLVSALNGRPVAIAIDASHYSFQLYSGGVYYERACSSSNLDHAVMAVGYGSSTQGDYFIVKNSWGTSWGDRGYIDMARNRNNNCGVATDCSYPTVN